MYIKRVTLQDFGRLSGTIDFSPDRCNIICQNNEFGKTTILDAVLYTLYNFPSTGFARNTLKPKDRYKPWGGAPRGSGRFVVELELSDIGGRDYQLRADFTEQQPFTLRDATTLQPIPLDGMPFGQRYLRMSMASFTQAFFLRQDEKENSGRGQLVSVIEEAAASNRQEAPSNVSQALELLAGPRVAVPGFCDEAILPRTLIKRLEDNKKRLVSERDALQTELARHRREMESAGELDERIATLEDQIARDDLELLRARRNEKQILLGRYNEGREAQAERQRLLEELEPYATIDLDRRSQIVSLMSDWKLARQGLQQLQNSIEAQLNPEITAVEAELASYPETAHDISRADIDTLRKTRMIVADRQEQLARTQQELEAVETSLRADGVPLDRLAELQQSDANLTAADREILFEHTAAHTEAQAALVNIEQNALSAREQVSKAKSRRAWYASLGMGLTGIVVAFMVVGVVLLLTNNSFFGWVSLLLAAVTGAGSILYITAMRGRVATQEMEPAIEAEMALAGEARKIQEQLDTIESEYEATLQRLQLTPEQVNDLREAHQWRQAAAPWQTARASVDRLQRELAEAMAETLPLLQSLGMTSRDHANEDAQTGASVSAETMGQAVTAAENIVSSRENLAELRQKSDRLNTERQVLDTDFQSKDQALAALVDVELTSEQPGLEEKAQAYLSACEKALQLQTLRREYGAVQTMSPEEAETLRATIASLDGAINAAAKSAPSSNETMRGLSADELERQLAQMRKEREELKERRNRGFRDAEKAVTEWRTRGPELEAALSRTDEALADVTDFAEACELARTQLSDIANEVYTQWASALNQRVNHIMPMLNSRYTQVALSQELDFSVHSQEAGRRLDSKDIQHLSKGARDQLLLAVRIAIAEYLSAHVGNLPLALDEPFAHWDDHRFIDGMRFLGNLATRHQVILLSCHQWRYNQLREIAPDLYDQLQFSSIQESDR